MRPLTHPTARRWTFAVYAAVLFTLTHWPRLRVAVPGIERPDLVIHLACFGGWTVLLWWSGLCGEITRRSAVGRAWLVGLAYAAFDEGTQALPVLGRHAAWDDLLANWLGVSVGAAAAACAASVARTHSQAGRMQPGGAPAE